MNARCILVTLFVIALGACSVSQDLTLRVDGSGDVQLRVSVHPIMVAYYNDLLVAMSGVDAEFPLFDLGAIERTFAERDGVSLTSISSPARGELRLSLDFADVGALGESDQAPFVTFTRAGERRTATLRLDRSAIDHFLRFAPEDSTAMTEFLFPPADGSMSAAEFEEQLQWALEEYDEPARVREAIRGAVIEVRVRPQGRIVGVTGGERQGELVVFRVPVIEALTLQQTQTYSVTFVP